MNYTLITGATGYLGRAFAIQCLARGENLYLTGRSAERLSALRTELVGQCPNAKIEIFPCDLSVQASRAALFADASRFKFSRLINVAGADIQKPFCEYDEAKLTFQVRSNFEGALSMCLFCLNQMAESLHIINISSICGEYVMPYFAVYSAAKGALTAFSLALSKELKNSAVKVTAVLPGAIHTRPDIEEYIKAQGAWGAIAAKSPEYVAAKSLAASDRGRAKLIVGGANKFLYYASKAVPRAILIRLNAKMRKHTRKDAF